MTADQALSKAIHRAGAAFHELQSARQELMEMAVPHIGTNRGLKIMRLSHMMDDMKDAGAPTFTEITTGK